MTGDEAILASRMPGRACPDIQGIDKKPITANTVSSQWRYGLADSGAAFDSGMFAGAMAHDRSAGDGSQRPGCPGGN